jgi:hypothetical protein
MKKNKKLNLKREVLKVVADTTLDGAAGAGNGYGPNACYSRDTW